MKWYWWALIALVVIIAIVMGWNAYQKSKMVAAANGTSTVPTTGTTVTVGTTENGTKVVSLQKKAA